MTDDGSTPLDNVSAAALAGRLLGRDLTVLAWRGLARRSGIVPDLSAGGHPLYWPATVERIVASAPGQGRRTDLTRPAAGRPETLEDMAERMPVTIHGVAATAVFTIPSLAAWLGIPESTVRYWSVNGGGPARYRRGREVRYDAAQVKAWLATRLAARPGDSVTRAIVAKHPRLRPLAGLRP